MASTYPDWKVALWRGFRSAVAAGFAVAIATPVSWTEPAKAVQVLGVAFVAGVLTAAGVYIRNTWGNPTQTSLVDKIII
jgi:hypothetical protein